MEGSLINTLMSPISNVCVIMVMAYLVSHSNFYSEILDGKRTFKNQLLLLLTFSLFSLYAATAGGIVNVRVLGPMLAGLVGGPVIGVGAAVVSSVHRFYDLRFGLPEITYSAILATFLAGLAGGLVNKWKHGQLPAVWTTALFAAGFELFHMALTLVVAKPTPEVVETVRRFAPSMTISHAVGAALFVYLAQNLVTARNARLANEKMQRELQKSEERFATAFNLNPTPMTIRRVKDNHFIAVNDSFLVSYECAREDIIEKRMEELPFYLENYNDFLQLLQENKSVRNFETRVFTKSGKVRDCLLFADIVNIGSEPHVLAAFVDITEKKRLEEEVLRLDRLNMVGQMAANVAHEIRNPLTSVRGNLQMIGMKEEDRSKKERYDMMVEELDRTNAIISEYLLMAKDKVPNREDCSLNNIIKTLCPLLETNAAAANSVIKLTLENIPQLSLDKNEIRQLLLNLISNGLEAMPAGGEIAIHTFLDDDKAVLRISDQGCGIPREIMENLGTPFLTTKSDGTGLGLPMCYRIANRHNATIDVETSPQGTIFSIIFPVAA